MINFLDRISRVVARIFWGMSIFVVAVAVLAIVAYAIDEGYAQRSAATAGLFIEFIITAAIALAVTIVGATGTTMIHRSFDNRPEDERARDHGDVFRGYVVKVGVFIAPIATGFSVIRVIEALRVVSVVP